MKDKVFKIIFFTSAIIMILIASAIVYLNRKKDYNKVVSSSSNLKISKEINFGITEFDTINPVLTTNIDVQYISKLVFRQLINISTDFKIENDLVEEYSKINDKTYIIKLKPNVKWQNNDNLNAEDVKFTIENLKIIDSIYSENVKHIKNIEIIDEYTMKLYLDEEINFFEYLLTFPILNHNYYEEKTLKSKTKIPIGSGEYSITNISDKEIILKNENTKMIVKIYDNSNELYEALEKENINLLCTQNIEYENYTGKLGINNNQSSGREIDYIAINNKNKILADKNIRKAINCLIDRKKIIYNIYNNKYLQINFPINIESYLYKEYSENYDVNKAKEILLDEGWELKNDVWQKNSNRLEFYLLVNVNNKTRCEVAEQIKKQLLENGIVINIIEANDYYYNQKLEYQNYDMALTGNILSVAPGLSTYFGENNILGYKNDEILSILNNVKSITNEDVLKEQYYRIQEIFEEEVPFITLYVNTNFILYNSKIKGDFLHNWYNLFYNVNNWYVEKN